MTNFAPANLPTASPTAPAAPDSISGPNAPRGDGADEFEAMLQRHCEPDASGSRPFGDKPTRTIAPEAKTTEDVAAANDAVEVQPTVTTGEGDATDVCAVAHEEADAVSTDEANSASAEAEATVLSNQLAMWQFVPRPIENIRFIEPKLAAPPAATGDPEVAEAADGKISSAEILTQSDVSEKGTEAGRTTVFPAAETASPAGATERTQGIPVVPPKADGGAAKVASHGVPATPSSVDDSTANPLIETSLPAASIPLVHGRVASGGIPGAKEQRAMTDRENLPSALPETAAFAAGNGGSISGLEVAPITAENGRAFREQGGENLERNPEPTLLAGVSFSVTGKPTHDVPAATFSTPVHASDAARVIEKIERAVEQARVQGDQRIEMRVPLQEGGELIVRLQLEAGQVKATFQTEAGGLRDALEAGWSQFAATAPVRALKVGQAVFESPTLQSGLGGFSQSPDQRQRQQAIADVEAAASTPGALRPFTRGSAEPPRLSVSVPAAAGLSLYA